MQASHAESATGVLAAGAGAGSIVSVLHAIAETSLLGFNSILPSALDLAIIFAGSLAVGLAVGIGAALVALLPFFRSRPAWDRVANRRIIWAVIFCFYFLLLLKVVSYWAGWGITLRLAAMAVPVLALAGFVLLKKAYSARVLFYTAALLAFTLCALNLAGAEWGHLGISTAQFYLRLLSPIAVCLVIFVVALGTSRKETQFESLSRTVAPLLLATAIWGSLWAAVFFQFSPSNFFESAPIPPRASRPNILLIVLDTVRADHLDLFGYERETMPNLTRFAHDECQSFHPMMTTSSWTLPSHASMFTGLYPSAHGAHYPSVAEKLSGSPFLAYSLRDDTPTVAEFLGSAGYKTAGIAANFAMLSHYGLPRGFQHYDVAPGAYFFSFRTLWLYRSRIGYWRSAGEWIRDSLPEAWIGRSRMFSIREPGYRRAHEINGLARDWIQEHRDQPFFLFLNFMDAHDPYLPLAEDDQRFAKRPPGEEWRSFPENRYRDAIRGMAKFTPEEIEFLKAQYDAGLVSMDRELGKLFEYLRRSRLFDNTLILITSDHGEAFFEHGFPQHGNTLYQPEVGGFLLVKAPPSAGSIEVSPAMQFVDFFPTFADVISKPMPAEVQGTAWGKGRDYSLAEGYCKTCACEFFGLDWTEEFRADQTAVVIGSQKLIRSTKEPDRVFEISSDPGETNPIAAPDAQFLGQAESAIAERTKYAAKKPNPVTSHDDALIERLRSLGYAK